MKYRQYFGLTPKQFREEVDLSDFICDMDMMNIEGELSQKKLPNEEVFQN